MRRLKKNGAGEVNGDGVGNEKVFIKSV